MGQLRSEKTDSAYPAVKEKNAPGAARGTPAYNGFCPWDPAGAAMEHNPCDTHKVGSESSGPTAPLDRSPTIATQYL